MMASATAHLCECNSPHGRDEIHGQDITEKSSLSACIKYISHPINRQRASRVDLPHAMHKHLPTTTENRLFGCSVCFIVLCALRPSCLRFTCVYISFSVGVCSPESYRSYLNTIIIHANKTTTTAVATTDPLINCAWWGWRMLCAACKNIIKLLGK